VYAYTRFGYCKLDLDQFEFAEECVQDLQESITKSFSNLRQIQEEQFEPLHSVLEESGDEAIQNQDLTLLTSQINNQTFHGMSDDIDVAED